MKNKTKFNRITSLVLALLLFGMLLIPMFTVSTSAAERQYSSVLDDLKKDADFDSSLYPQYELSEIISINNDSDKENDVKLASLIGIAESESSELFLYVYEPCPSDCKITSVSMYCGFSHDGKNFSANIYNLSLLSEEGVFSKYRVEGFEVLNEEERYYNFLALFYPR